MSVIEPEIDTLLATVDSKYTLCVVAAKRARQINDMAHNLREQAALLPTVPMDEIADLTRKKPLSKALEEIAKGDVSYERVKESFK